MGTYVRLTFCYNSHNLLCSHLPSGCTHPHSPPAAGRHIICQRQGKAARQQDKDTPCTYVGEKSCQSDNDLCVVFVCQTLPDFLNYNNIWSTIPVLGRQSVYIVLYPDWQWPYQPWSRGWDISSNNCTPINSQGKGIIVTLNSCFPYQSFHQYQSNMLGSRHLVCNYMYSIPDSCYQFHHITVLSWTIFIEHVLPIMFAMFY